MRYNFSLHRHVRLTCHRPSVFPYNHPGCFAIASCIRFGYHYGATALAQQCIAYLCQYFPSTYDEYDALTSFVPPFFEPIHAISVINLARLTGTHSLLPAAIIACSYNLSNANILAGVHWPDGTHDVLTPSDLALCLSAKLTLAHASLRRLAFRCYPAASHTCKRPRECIAALQMMLGSAIRTPLKAAIPYPFYPWKPAQTDLWGLCAQCLCAVRTRDIEETRRIWGALPGMLGLEPIPGWGTAQPSGQQTVDAVKVENSRGSLDALMC